ncbi:MAG: TonB-dependent receptor [Cytophagales bacterium]|nr:TonB-dependent receptor [Cytophagales bacterium]
MSPGLGASFDDKMINQPIPKAFFAALAVCLNVSVLAQDTLNVVQTHDYIEAGSKVEMTLEKFGKAIYRLDSQQIASNKGKDISDLLNEIPGIHVDGNFAAPGTSLNLWIRGAQSDQTLVLIDGIPFNDPSGTAQEFDLRLLDLLQIESIEVIKGGMGSLYGTGASVGVISIVTNQPANEKFVGNLNFDLGSFNTSATHIDLSGTSGGFNYLVSSTTRGSGGFSEARDTSGKQNYDDDGANSVNFLGKVGYQFSDQFSIGFTSAYHQVLSDIDGTMFLDNVSFADLSLLRVAFNANYNWSKGSIRGNFSYHRNKRTNDLQGIGGPADRKIFNFSGNFLQADVMVNQKLSNELEMIGGINLQQPTWEPEEEMADTVSFTMLDPYMSFIYNKENLNVQLGGRLSFHSISGTNFVWDINPSYLFDLGSGKLKVFGAYATTFLTPTLRQFYGGDLNRLVNDAGNLDLDAEQSETIEGGANWIAIGKLSGGVAYFFRKDKNFVELELNEDRTIGRYVNLTAEREVNGLELNARYAFSPQLSLSGYYTYTNALTRFTVLRRIPKNKFLFTLSALPVEKLLVKLTYLAVGETRENNDISLDTYDVFDLDVSYDLSESIFIAGSINNVFDEGFVSRNGLNSTKRNFNIGLRYRF